MRKNLGFTLIELIMVIGIVAIMAAIAIPSVMRFLPNYRLKGAARNFYSNMQKARMEAIKRNSDVLISFVPGTYDPAGGIGSYQIFVDNTPENDVLDAGETILGQVNMPTNVTMYSTNFTNNTAGYNARGLPASNDWGNVVFRNNISLYYRASLSSAGIVRITKSLDGITWN